MAGTGFEPVGFLGSRPFAGQVNRYWIATGATNEINYGMPVALNTTGTVTGLLTSPVQANHPVGIFLGCSYLDSEGRRQSSQKWPAAQTSLGAYAYVADDPTTIFRVKVLNGSGVDATATIANIGMNCAADVTTPEIGTTSGRCGFGVSGFATTAALAFKVVGLTNDNVSVASTDVYENYVNTASTTFTHALVTWNFGVHHYQFATGLA